MANVSERARPLAFAFLVIAFAALTAAYAGDPARPVNFDLPPQSLATSLRALAHQADIQIIFSPEDVAGRDGPAISGAMSAREALARLLEATPLEFVVEGEDTIVIRSRRPAAPAPASAPSTAAAPEATAPERRELEEITVTAQKRSESLQDTPISIAALTGPQLEAKGIHGLSDLQAEVPNLQLTSHPNSPTTTRLWIRGVGNNDDQITQDPSVAVYVDGLYIGRSQGLATEVADLERIEILRGPQGSLYGRNATGGAINFITQAPELGQFGFAQNLSFGNYDLFRANTRLNMPLGEVAALQLSYLHAEKEGFIENAGGDVDRFGDQDRNAYRAALRWMPAEALDIRYSYDRTEIGDTPQFVGLVPLHPQKAVPPDLGSPFVRGLRANDVVAQGHGLTVSWNVTDSATVKSIAGYRELRNRTNQNFLTGVLGPFPLFTNSFDEYQEQLTEELQLVGAALDGGLEYVAGAYYFDESGNSVLDQRTAAGARVERFITVDNRAYALYGQVTYTPEALDGRLHLTAGSRWSRDDRTAALREVVTTRTGSSGRQGLGDKSHTDFSPSATAAFDITADINAYLRVAKGYKTGGYNVRASTIQRFEEGFGPESLLSYELGIKSDLLDRRLRVNAAVFLSNYKDIQLGMSDPTDPSRTDILNAGKATVKGIELDVSARLSERLGAAASYGFLDADYDEALNVAGQDVSDQFAFIRSPKHSLSTSLDYTIAATPLGELAAVVGYRFQTRQFAQTTNSARHVIGDHGLLDARLTLDRIPIGFGNLRLALWGRNLTDKNYYVDVMTFGPSLPPAAIFGAPRSYGLEMIFQY